MGDSYELRGVTTAADDNTATHRISIARRDSLALGVADLRVEQYMAVGHPLQWLQATTVTGGGVTVVGYYPNDATAIASVGAACAAAAAGTLTLATGAPDWDLTGWHLMMLSGAAIGDVRRINAYNTGTRVATVDRNWSTTPATNDLYTIGLNTEARSWVVVKAECQGTNAQAPSLSVIPVLLDYPRDPKTSGVDQGVLGLAGVARAPRIALGALLDMDNYDVQSNTVVASYYQMRVRSDQCLGAQLAKIRLHTAPGSSQKCVLFLGAV